MAVSSPRDANFVPALIATSSTDGTTVVKVYADPTTHRLLVDLSALASLMQTDTFTSTASQTAFGASKTVGYTMGLYVNGSLQTPTTDYTVSGTTATLTSGIPAGNTVVWVYATA